jgi:hypothetical protein
MKLLFFLVFVVFSSAFEFGFEDNVSFTEIKENNQQNVVATEEPERTTTTQQPDAKVAALEIETTTTTEQPRVSTPTTEATSREGVRSMEAIGTTTETTTEKNRSLETDSFPPRVEVVVTKSLYRIIDEKLRERLINLESRIANLQNEKERRKDQIVEFGPTFDDAFFEKAFDVDR